MYWMNCERACVSLFWIGMVAGCSGVILQRIHFIDADFGKVDFSKIRWLWIIYSLVVSVVFLWHIKERGWLAWCVYGLLAVYFILCSVMDCVLKMVCDFFHYIGLAGGCLLLMINCPKQDSIYALLIFVGIQWILFRKMYGPADVAAFMVCAVYLAAEGKGLQAFLMHMAVSFTFLGVVQGLKKNISHTGNLKYPVALFPYIAAGFFVII